MFANLEYITLRMVRKFLFTPSMMNRFSRWIPYYQPTLAQFNPEASLEQVWPHFAAMGIETCDKTFLELGSGSTNGVGYLIASRGGANCLCFEPYVPFRAERDQALYDRIAASHPAIADKVRRIVSLEEALPQSIDRVISISVLEHVYDLDTLLSQLRPLLRPGFQMLHAVDYRDHFFKYPLHFLQFSDAAWHRYLDPGNMPRPRLNDHILGFQRHGCTVKVLKQTIDMEAFQQVRTRLAPRFRDRTPEDLATTFALLLVTEASPAQA